MLVFDLQQAFLAPLQAFLLVEHSFLPLQQAFFFGSSAAWAKVSPKPNTERSNSFFMIRNICWTKLQISIQKQENKKKNILKKIKQTYLVNTFALLQSHGL